MRAKLLFSFGVSQFRDDLEEKLAKNLQKTCKKLAKNLQKFAQMQILTIKHGTKHPLSCQNLQHLIYLSLMVWKCRLIKRMSCWYSMANLSSHIFQGIYSDSSGRRVLFFHTEISLTLTMRQFPLYFFKIWRHLVAFIFMFLSFY